YEVDFAEVGAGLLACLPCVAERRPATRSDFVHWTYDVQQAHETAIAAAVNLYALFHSLLKNLCAQRWTCLFIPPLADHDGVSICDRDTKKILETDDEHMVEIGPQLWIFEIGVHSRERAGHLFSLP